MAAAPAPAPAPAAAPPAWLHRSGAARVQSEMRSLGKSIASGALPGIRRLGPVDDNIMVWRLEVIKFDADTRAGRKLNDDLQTLGSKWGKKYAAVELELRFPDDYPSSPFFLRVVHPRMAAYSGHVTAGGAVCLEALTLSGGPGGWRSDMCVEAVLVMALHNMLHAEEVYVKTAMGGGQAGPLRINMSLGQACLQEYSLGEAEQAFQRTLANHQWGGGRAHTNARPTGGGAAAAAAAAAGAWASSFAPSLPAAGAAHPRWVPSARAGAQPQLQRGAVRAPQGSMPQARGAAPAAVAAPAKKRPADEDAEVVVVSDSEDEGPSIPRPPPAKRGRRSAPSSRQAAAAGPAGSAARSAGLPQGGQASDDVVDLTGLASAPVGSSHAGQSHNHTPAAGHSPAANRPQAVGQQPAAVPSQHAQQLPAELGLEMPKVPHHWQVTEELLRGELVLVDLPLPGAAPPQDERLEQAVAQLVLNGCSREQALGVLDEHGGDLEASLASLLEQQADPGMTDLLANGLTAEDAQAALRQCGGDVNLALAWAFECMEAGGPAAVARRTGKATGGSGRGAPLTDSAAARQRRAERAEQEAQHRQLQEESARVLQRFVRTGMKREQVQRIQRVQNLELYEDYCRRRAKIEREIKMRTGGRDVGALLNERQLFHGADKETLGTIMAQGFDHRVSNLHGALGAGVYFADTATYSDGYSRTAKHSADMADGYGAGFQHLGGGGWRANAHAALSMAAGLASRGSTAVRQPAGASSAPALSMLLCDVTLGVAGTGKPGMRRAAPGSNSSSSGPPGGAIHAVYHNDQAYPAYIIHYR